MPLFPTWIYSCESGPQHLNPGLEELTHKLMEANRNATVRTNEGGWHYAFDLFELQEPIVAEFRELMVQHIEAFLNHLSPERRTNNKTDYQLKGWINVNHAGDRNVLHCHPGCFLSGTYYVKVPSQMKGGEILFRDPRGPAVKMYEVPGIHLPWVASGMGTPFVPKQGYLLIFSSWLEHRVESYEGPGERISIAFNASAVA